MKDDDVDLLTSSTSRQFYDGNSVKINTTKAKLPFIRPPDDGYEPRDHRRPTYPIS